jgi:glycosyltransferase involved in cell wall biosynthesis
MIEDPLVPDTRRASPPAVEEGDAGRPRPSLSVVAPVYNEEDVLPELHKRLAKVIDALGSTTEIIYVNDGSGDGSLALLYQLHGADPRVAVLNLSRNFGKDIALSAGLDYSRGEAVIVIDSDLQDPPEVIPELIARWREGYDVVYATRVARSGESFFKKFTAKHFYRLMRNMSRVEIPADTGDFRLLSRRAVDALGRLREHHRFMKGLFAWIGYPHSSVPYERDPRFAGQSKWSYWKLWNFALEGITSFSTGPLKVASYVGLTTAVIAFLYAIWVVYKALRFGDPVAGYPSLMTVILFLGGVQLMTLGIIGEYLGRMFNETKQRPLYLVEAYWKPRSVGARSDRRMATGR